MSASANHLPPLDPPSGPSRPKPSPRRRSPSIRPPNSSSCEIVKTSSTPPAGHNTPDLLEGDLLGSFDDFKSSEASLPAGHVHPGGQKHEFDLLGGEMWSESPSTNHARPPDAARSRPIHINLPPRPSEISPDYAPPLRSPRRASPSYSVPGPGSPPLLSEAGRDIIFHPILDTPRDDSHIDLIKFRQRGNPRSESNGHSNELHDTPVDTSQLRSAAHSTLLNALATTTKLANKWKSVLEPVVDASPAVHDRYPRSLHHTELGGRSLTALPIDITHFSPFASAEQVAGSHIAPTGAPGYDPQLSAIFNHTRNSEDDFTGTRLLGRREGTYEVLSHSNADKVRKQLPPRQRLSAMWTLLFSLDQHGVSLSTLYRLVDKYTFTHPISGNVLVVRDAQDNVFGVYMNEAITRREGTYYGSGESFLFKLPSGDTEAQAFRWTGKNQYFALCEAGFISFGGGAGAYGLLLDCTFSHNSSATCPAYDNDVLCRVEACKCDRAFSFDCVGLEVWGT